MSIVIIIDLNLILEKHVYRKWRIIMASSLASAFAKLSIDMPKSAIFKAKEQA
jgi:hypothetical protein